MRMLIGLSLLLLFGATLALLIAWLSGRPFVAARIAGALLAGVVATYSSVVVIALTADNIGMSLRLPGVLSILVFAFIGVGAIACAVWGGRTRASRRIRI
jgi:hypothetical protein